jgi:hypothetical protein
MVIYSYVVTRDYGFAPNPFFGYCTLATCKPRIRKSAQVGDWIIGVGSSAQNSKFKNRLIYTMCIEEKLLFNDYWNDVRFKKKKPVMNGSNKQLYGDNIYHKNINTGEFIQENSHHSLENGFVNEKNYKRDLSGEYVLISKNYWYFGEDAIPFSDDLKNIIHSGIGYSKYDNKSLIDNFIIWIHQKDPDIIGKPAQFSGEFVRYKGE